MKAHVFLNKTKPALSETFIQAHIDRLGGSFSNLYTDLRKLKKRKGKLKSVKSFLGIDIGQNRKSLLEKLQQKGIVVALAEYGMVGADCLEFCRKYSLPLVIHFHGYDAHRKKVLSKYREKYLDAFKYAKGIVVVSTKMYDQLLALGASPDKLHLNVYGVDTNVFQQVNVEENGPVLVAVGRMVDKKAPHLTVLAFKKALGSVPDARLIMAGDGYLFEAVSRLVRALGIQDKVALLGAVPHPEVVKIMHTARAFVQHSVEAFDGDSEGTPVSILEAGASGLPVISTRHAGINDVVKSGETGLLVEEGDVAGMAENMVRVLQGPSYALDLGCAARELINTHFRLDQSLDRLEQILFS